MPLVEAKLAVYEEKESKKFKINVHKYKKIDRNLCACSIFNYTLSPKVSKQRTGDQTKFVHISTINENELHTMITHL